MTSPDTASGAWGRTAAVALLWPVALVCVAALAHPAGAGVLRGRLLVGEQAATGVTVSAIPYEAPLEQARRETRRLPAPPPLAAATTGPDGTFALAVPARPEGPTLFTVRADGAAVASASLSGVWDATETADVGEHVLSPGASLGGKVVDATGAPVADAEIVVLPRLDRSGDTDIEAAPCRATTAEDGTFRVVGASLAGNALIVDKAGALVVQQRGVRAGTLRPIALAAGVVVAGHVRNADGVSPAVGALVRIEGQVTTRWVETGDDGAYTIPNAPPGPATAVADAGEAGFRELPGVVLPLGQGRALDLVLRPAAALAGRTLDAATKRPVPRVRIALRAGGRSRVARSAPDGTYSFRGLPPGSWRLRADEPRYVAWTHANVPVRSGETKTLDIPLVLGATLSGRVTDEDGKPVAAALGTLAQTGAITPQRLLRRFRGVEAPAFKTRADGTFTATRLAPGDSQILTIAHPDFERATVGGVDLAGGATKAGVAVVLKRGAAITGVVKDGQGQPIAGARAELTQAAGFGGGRGGRGGGGRGGGGAARVFAAMQAPPGSDRKSATSGADGAFAIRGVAPGEYVVTVTSAGFASERVDPVKVPEQGSTPPLEVTLRPGAVISGRVAFRSGLGAEGFRVFVGSPGRPRFAPPQADEPATGSDGAFTIDGLRPGESYDLEVVGPTGPREGKNGVVAPAGDVEITVAGSGRITGTAVDATSGSPLTEYQVAYAPDRGGGRPGMLMMQAAGGGGAGQPVDVQSDDGSFALENVPAGTWSVIVTAAGYQSARTGAIVVEEGATRDGVVVRAARGTVVKGHVADAQTTAAIANATVSLSPTGSQPARGFAAGEAASGDVTTDGDGDFEIDGAATGKQTVRVSHSDYTDAVQTVDVADEGATVTIQMTQGGAVTGLVAADTGQPVPGATVTLATGAGGGGGMGFGGGAGGGIQETVSDSAGHFSFDHVAGGRYTLTASLGSRTATPVELVLQPGQSQENVALQLETGVTLLGTVTGLAGTALSGLTVNASGADSYAQTTRAAADGSFEFDNVPAGIVTVRGTATTAAGSTRSATAQVTAAADQPVVTVELAFPQGFALTGRVSRAGQPVSGALVVASLAGSGRQATATSDDGGAYRLEGLQEGTYSVMAMSSAAGAAASKRQTIMLTEDQTLDVELPSASIAGQVVDADTKAPLANATVSVAAQSSGAGPGPGQRPVVTDSNGQFSFTGLDEGSYTLSTSRSDYQLDQRDVSAGDGSGDGLVVPLKRGAGLGLRAVDGLTGLPLRAVTVRILDGQGVPVIGPLPVALDGDGQGEIASLPPGVYTVVAAASGYAAARLDGVNVPSALLTIALTPGGSVLIQTGAQTLAAGAATATITGVTGQPAVLSLFNLQGRVAISEPNVQLRNVPPGGYVLSLPAGAVSQTFTVGEGSLATVQLP